MTISSTNTKNSYSGDGTTVAFSYTFKILDDDDIQVILRTDATGTETVQTKTTDYTVSGVGNAGGGTITFGSAPAATETVVLLRNVPLTQTTDYTPNDPFPAATHEDALDKLTLMAQDTQEEVDRSIKLSRTNTMTSTEFTVGATTRANKIFAFDSSGELAVTQEIGTFQGDWAASTAYAERDLVKDTSTNNIFIVNSAHTSSGSQPLTTNPNSSKYDLIVDAAAATTSATNAASSATAAAASATAAAASESAAATSETNAAASEAGVAADAAAAAASASSASTSATNASTSETNASNSASAAATSATNAATSATSASNSASAAGTSESNAATSATNASNSASAAATSASNAATSESNASTSETNAATSASSAASDASAAATSAAAAAASFDAFDDIYLGAKASAPTVDNDGDALTEGDQYFNTTNNTLFVWNGSAWQAASPDIVGDTTPQLGGNLDTNGNDINFGDNDKAVFGAGSDLEVFSNGTVGLIRNGNATSDIRLESDNRVVICDRNFNEAFAIFNDDDDVKLYHNSFEKFATTATGIDVTGTVTADGVKVGDNQNITLGADNDMTINHGGTNAAINNGTGNLSYNSDQHIFGDEFGTERMRIDSSGNVGIGNSAPASPLDIKPQINSATLPNTPANHSITIQPPTTTGNYGGGIGWCEGGVVNTAASINAVDAGSGAALHLAFATGSSSSIAERVRITTDGNVLVGKTASGVANTGAELQSSGFTSITRDGGAPLQLNRKTSDGDLFVAKKDGTTVGSIGTVNGDLYLGTGDTGLYFNDGADAFVPVNSSTGANRDNAIDIGGSTVRFKDLYLSGGAYIGGTAAANQLDDYEEGDFTPAIWEGTSAIGDAAYNTSFTKGTYIKIGRMVMITMSLRLTSKGTPTGSSNFRIGGFPFTTTNDVKARSAFATYDHDATGIDTTGNSTGTLHAFISNGVNYVGFRVSDPSQAVAETLTYDDLGNDTYLQLTGTIVVD